MTEFIDYARSLMESAKGFARKSNDVEDTFLKQAYLRAALLHGFFFLEAHLNDLCEHFENNDIFSIHEQGILLEREVRLEKGQFKLKTGVKYYRLTERVELILYKCTEDVIKAKGDWFSHLNSSINIRNQLVHPRNAHKVTHKEVSIALSAIIDCIDVLYRAVFRKELPYKNKSMEGGYEF